MIKEYISLKTRKGGALVACEDESDVLTVNQPGTTHMIEH